MEQSFNWIKDNIESCLTQFQLDCCWILIDLFDKKYGDDGYRLKDELLSSWLAKEAMI